MAHCLRHAAAARHAQRSRASSMLVRAVFCTGLCMLGCIHATHLHVQEVGAAGRRPQGAATSVTHAHLRCDACHLHPVHTLSRPSV